MSLYKLVTVNWASLKAEARVLPTGYQCPEITSVLKLPLQPSGLQPVLHQKGLNFHWRLPLPKHVLRHRQQTPHVGLAVYGAKIPSPSHSSIARSPLSTEVRRLKWTNTDRARWQHGTNYNP